MRRSVAAGAALLAIYVALSFLNSPRGFLGTDTGGKVATLEVMTAGDGVRFDPDIGYWAEEWDPDGSLHPLYYTSHIGDRWVNVTTLPMLFAAAPLYEVGGYRAALLLPMLAAVAAAFAAEALARRTGSTSPWVAFWVVGLASPMTIHALDFWEHSVGVALMAWAIVFLSDVVASDGRAWPRSAIAGALLGAAATMRTETFVYVAVAGVVVAATLLRRRAPLARVAIGGAVAFVAFGLVFAANHLLERAVLGDGLRAERAAGTAVAAGDGPTDRLGEAALTLFAAAGNERGILIGIAVVALLTVAVVRHHTDPRFAAIAFAGAAVLLALRAASGLGFVPGLFVAWPLAIVGALAFLRVLAASEPAKPRKTRAGVFLATVALVALPVVLATQFRGGAAPQWAGRYVLTSGLLLTAVGVASATKGVRVVVVGFAVATTAFGIAWTSTRTYDVDRAIAAINDRPEPIVVSTVAHLGREGGATYGDKRWLTATSPADFQEAATVVGAVGERALLVVTLPRAQELPSIRGWRRGPTTTVGLFGTRLRLQVWESP